MKFLDALLPEAAPVAQRDSFQFGGQTYGLTGDQGYTTLYGKNPVEPIQHSFEDYVRNGLFADGVIFAIELKRLAIFAEARFQ